MISNAINPKVSTTKLLRIDLDAKTCLRYSGKEQTHGFLFGEEHEITPALCNSMIELPDTIAVEEAVA